MLLAWLRHEDNVSVKTAEAAVLLGQYQVASHEFYLTKKMDNPVAAIQAKILRALKMQGPAKKRELQRRTHADRVGTDWWARALDGLLKDGMVGRREDGTHFLAE